MTGPTTFDDTSNDRERFEAEELARDHDAARPRADLTDAAARHLVNDLLDEGVVIPVEERRGLIHDPTGEVFDSITQLAVFHRGWTAARAADAEEP